MLFMEQVRTLAFSLPRMPIWPETYKKDITKDLEIRDQKIEQSFKISGEHL